RIWVAAGAEAYTGLDRAVWLIRDTEADARTPRLDLVVFQPDVLAVLDVRKIVAQLDAPVELEVGEPLQVRHPFPDLRHQIDLCLGFLLLFLGRLLLLLEG